MKIGIVGLPNVGKSSLFTALTKKEVGVSNYPFTTIDPNVSVVPVPDARLEKLAAVSRSARIVPATVEFVDIAGLVRGANKGEGLGNQFLAHIREVDAIVEVVRAFENVEIIHVEGTPDSMRDHEIIETELILKDLETVEKRLPYIEKEAMTGKKEAIAEANAMRKIRKGLVGGTPVRVLEQDDTVAMHARLQGLLTAKPLMILINTTDHKKSESMINAFRRQGIRALAMNVKDELDAASFSLAERKTIGAGMPALDRLIIEAYALLGLVSFLTTGEKETRAWTIVAGTKAPQAAGIIHSDFEKKFIRAETIHWEKFLKAGGWVEARAKGWVRSEGKEYVVQDGDVLDIKHG